MECLERLTLLRQGANQKSAYFIPNSESTRLDFSLKLVIAKLGTEDCFRGLKFFSVLMDAIETNLIMKMVAG